MAINVSNLFCQFNNEHTLSTSSCENIFNVATYTRTVEDFKRIRSHCITPAIIIAASGMAEGGRVLHHLKVFITDAKNTVLFVGFQASGTHGRLLVDGAQQIRIHGQTYPVKADIKTMYNFSAHADYNDILEWLAHFEKAPQKTFLTHGEKEAC